MSEQEDELVLRLRADAELPAVVESEVFWAGFARGLDGAIAARATRRRYGWLAVAALLAIGLGVGLRPRHVVHPIGSGICLEGDCESDDTGALVEELSDQELERVAHTFQKGG